MASASVAQNTRAPSTCGPRDGKWVKRSVEVKTLGELGVEVLRAACGLVAALALTACGSPFTAAPADASTDATSEGGAKDASPDTGVQADADRDGSADAAVCPAVSTKESLCRGYLDYESACHLYEPCDCTYWVDNCATLTMDYSPAFDFALLACVTTNLKKCPSVTAIENCAYQGIINTKSGLTNDQKGLLEAYCMMCNPATVTTCMTSTLPFAGKFNDNVANTITNACTGDKHMCSDFDSCVDKTLGLTTGVCTDGG
jgi:hypothetical protein